MATRVQLPTLPAMYAALAALALYMGLKQHRSLGLPCPARLRAECGAQASAAREAAPALEASTQQAAAAQKAAEESPAPVPEAVGEEAGSQAPVQQAHSTPALPGSPVKVRLAVCLLRFALTE